MNASTANRLNYVRKPTYYMYFYKETRDTTVFHLWYKCVRTNRSLLQNWANQLFAFWYYIHVYSGCVCMYLLICLQTQRTICIFRDEKGAWSIHDRLNSTFWYNSQTLCYKASKAHFAQKIMFGSKNVKTIPTTPHNLYTCEFQLRLLLLD